MDYLIPWIYSSTEPATFGAEAFSFHERGSLANGSPRCQCTLIVFTNLHLKKKIKSAAVRAFIMSQAHALRGVRTNLLSSQLTFQLVEIIKHLL